jgi:hypothetical protein
MSKTARRRSKGTASDNPAMAGRFVRLDGRPLPPVLFCFPRCFSREISEKARPISSAARKF